MVPDRKAGKESFHFLKKSIYKKILKDDGYFSDIDPLDRMALSEKIQAAEPTAIITDCLSCRLQFQQMLSFPVYHPLEIISRAYDAFQVQR